jgi:hypothetical protein
MNKINKTLTRQNLLEQVKIELRTKYYSIQTKKEINKEIYMPIISHDCYFINADGNEINKE